MGLSLAGALGCNPATQSTSTTAAEEPAGANCATGGLVVRTGVDADGDGVVSASEASATHYVCNGATGAAGDAGTSGAVSLNKVIVEAAGANCATGGYALQTGVDDNDNGELDAAEVDATQYLCNSTAETPVVLSTQTYLGNADEACPGGYVRVGFGIDADGDGSLSSSEQTGSIFSCNLLPRITSGATVVIDDCTQDPIVVPVTVSDVDGEVTQTSVEVLSSGSPLAFSSGPNGEILLSPGAHLSHAAIEVTVTDNFGATIVTELTLVFVGTGCVPLTSFNGVIPTSCTSVDVNAFAGDDRSGPVVTGSYVYYNGDTGLVRTNLDLSGQVQLVPGAVDGLLGDAVQGKLLSLWSSEWDATLPDGGAGPGITGLTDPNAGGRFEAYSSVEPLDQLAVLDEVTLQPTARLPLPQPIVWNAVTFDLTASDGGVVTFNQSQSDTQMILAAAAGQALIARRGTSIDGQTGVLFQLIDTASGALTLSREFLFEAGDPAAAALNWYTQEDSLQHYALHKRGAEFVLTYRASSSVWTELELSAGQPVGVSGSFGTNCDVENLAISPNLDTVWFHSESSCFGSSPDEGLIRCATLYGPNDGGVDDSGGNGSPE